MKKFLLAAAGLALLCVFGPSASAQGVRVSDNVYTTLGNAPVGASAPLYSVPNAKITVCGYPATPSTGVCTNKVSIYSDQALTMALPNPLSADNQGRFGYWVAPGTYAYSLQNSGGTLLATYAITASGGGGGSGSVVVVSGVIANGFAVTVANPTTSPAITVNVDGAHVLPTNTGSAGTYLNGAGAYTTPPGGLTSFQGRTTPAAVLNTADVSGLGTLTNSTTGNAATASALNHSPTRCGTGFAPTGITATGDSTGCTPLAGTNGFPITLGSTPINASSTTTGINDLAVNGVLLTAVGDPSTYLNGAGSYTSVSANCPEGTCLVNAPTASQIAAQPTGTNFASNSINHVLSIVPGTVITSLSDAVAACASSPTTIQISAALTPNTITVPANCTLLFQSGGALNPLSGQTVTIQGAVQAANDVQIFGGAGTIAGLANSWMDWFGTPMSAGTMSKAINSTGDGSTVRGVVNMRCASYLSDYDYANSAFLTKPLITLAGCGMPQQASDNSHLVGGTGTIIVGSMNVNESASGLQVSGVSVDRGYTVTQSNFGGTTGNGWLIGDDGGIANPYLESPIFTNVGCLVYDLDGARHCFDLEHTINGKMTNITTYGGNYGVVDKSENTQWANVHSTASPGQCFLWKSDTVDSNGGNSSLDGLWCGVGTSGDGTGTVYGGPALVGATDAPYAGITATNLHFDGTGHALGFTGGAALASGLLFTNLYMNDLLGDCVYANGTASEIGDLSITNLACNGFAGNGIDIGATGGVFKLTNATIFSSTTGTNMSLSAPTSILDNVTITSTSGNALIIGSGANVYAKAFTWTSPGGIGGSGNYIPALYTDAPFLSFASTSTNGQGLIGLRSTNNVGILSVSNSATVSGGFAFCGYFAGEAGGHCPMNIAQNAPDNMLNFDSSGNITNNAGGFLAKGTIFTDSQFSSQSPSPGTGNVSFGAPVTNATYNILFPATAGTSGQAFVISGVSGSTVSLDWGSAGGTVTTTGTPATGAITEFSGPSSITNATGAHVASALSGQTITPKIINGVGYSTLYSGSTVDARVNACLADALALTNGNTTGRCDASGETGTLNTTAQITVGDSSGDPVTLILPATGLWVGTMTDGTSAVIKQYTGTSIVGTSPASGFGNFFTIDAGASSNLGYVYYALSAGTPSSYMYASNFAVNNTGHATANGIGTNIVGPFYDNTTWEHMLFEDEKDTKDVVAKGICCSTTFRNDQFQGSYVSQPLSITTVGAPSGATSVGINIVDSSIVHPGSGQNVFSCTDSAAHDTTINMENIYTETGNSDATTALYSVAGCGDVKLSGIHFRCEVSGPNCTNPGVNITNAFNTTFTADNVSFSNGAGSWTFNATAVANANSSQSVKTDSNGHMAHYVSGIAYASGFQTTVNGGVVQLGTGSGADNWMNMAGTRGYVGFAYSEGSNTMLAAASGHGVAFAVNASAWASWTVGGLFDQNANFGIGTQVTNALSDPFHVTPAGVVTATAYAGGGSTPTCTPGAAAGTGATCSANGNDTSFSVTLMTGTSPGTTGTLFTVSFATTLTSAPKVVFSPVGVGTASLANDVASATISTTAYSMDVGITALPTTTGFLWDFIAIQ